jgi:hypothetical protein
MALTVQDITQAGVALTTAPATGAGDSYANTGQEIIYVDNAGASPCNMTVAAPKLCNQGFNHPLVVTIPAGTKHYCGPFEVARYGSTVNLTYDQVVSVNIAVFKP